MLLPPWRFSAVEARSRPHVEERRDGAAGALVQAIEPFADQGSQQLAPRIGPKRFRTGDGGSVRSVHDPTSQPWAIIGAGGHGAAVAEVLAAHGSTIDCFVDAARVEQRQRFGIEIRKELPDGHLGQERPVALAVGDNAQRQRLWEELSGRGASDLNFPAVAHPSASVSQFAALETGAVVLQGACVGPAARVGRFAVVATGVVLTHDAQMDDFSFAAAGAVVGAAFVGERSFVGMGAIVSPASVVGADVIIGAQSYVRGELPDRVVARGIPAQPSRKREVGEPYLR